MSEAGKQEDEKQKEEQQSVKYPSPAPGLPGTTRPLCLLVIVLGPLSLFRSVESAMSLSTSPPFLSVHYDPEQPRIQM